MLPMMGDRETRIVENALLGGNRSRLRVLEWGCGGSTVYFPWVLARHGIEYSWVSLEYKKDWYFAVSEQVKDNKNIKLVLFEVVGEDPWSRACRMDEYVSFPATLGTEFDMILVDGRKRRRCLLEAKPLLAPGGVVFLHDAQRRRYHCVLVNYPDSRFLTRKLWRGTNEVLPRGARMRNKILSVFRLRLGKYIPL
jgi:SAM-dependent methyltransferase